MVWFRLTPRSCFALSLVIVMVSQEALAWGPRARRTICAAAISQVKRDVGRTLSRPGSSNEADVIRGAEAGIEALRSKGSLGSDRQALDTIMNEIELLRTVRQRGAGSYLAYRMGVLSSLVAQVILPYGFPQNDEERDLYARIMTDIERNVESYRFDTQKTAVAFIDKPYEYFGGKRPFIADDRRLIAQEYGLGVGYDGFFGKAAPAYFQRSVESVADAWYTIINAPDSPHHRAVSGRVLADYYIDEIRYQLEVKGSIDAADRAYRDFVEVNRAQPADYITVGDLYYAFATPESEERGVHEWKLAQRSPGPDARVAARRISGHYIARGQFLFARAETPDALDTDLEDAQRSFQTALEYDGTSETAANRVSEVTTAINVRRELYDQQQQFIDNAAVIVENAERSLLENDFSDALSSFQQALNLTEAVGPEFADLQEQAKDISSDLRKNIKNVISDIFDLANERMAEGDTMVGASQFEDALNTYRTVESILADLPEEEGSIDTQRKLDLLEVLTGKIEDADVRLASQQKKGKNRGNRR